jgi:hypothetical protein
MTKKILLTLLVISLSVPCIPATLKAESTAAAAAREQADARNMLNRLKEIKALSQTNLSSRQKKEFRKEVRAMQEKMKSMRPGIYLSLAAIIIILLLLILLF